MTQIISVISGKGGVGKTVLVSNLGAYLAQKGKDVLVIDGNLSGANLGLHLGLINSYPFSLNHVLKGKVSLNNAIYRHFLGFDIIPASLVDIEVNPRRLKHVISNLVGVKDFIIIDSAAGIDQETKAAVESSDIVIIITNPELPSLVDALRAKKLADSYKKKIAGVVVNKIRNEKFEIDHKTIEEMLELPVITKIPEHKKVRESIAMKTPIVTYSPYSPPAIEIKKLAHFLIGEEPPKTRFWHKVRGFLGK